MLTYIESEKNIEAVEQIPLTRMIYELLAKLDQFSEESVLTFDDWIKFELSILNYSTMPPLSSIFFKNVPNELGIENQ